MRWKIDLIILPAFLITQALQFMDKTALNYANLFDYQEALGLHGQQFNYLSACKSVITPLDLMLTSGSGLRRLFLRAIPLWLVDRSVPSTKDHGDQYLMLGRHGTCPDPVPVLFQCRCVSGLCKFMGTSQADFIKLPFDVCQSQISCCFIQLKY